MLKCYQNYPKVYKRIGPHSKNGGLEIFLLKVQNVKHLLEELITNHVKLTLPRYKFFIFLLAAKAQLNTCTFVCVCTFQNCISPFLHPFIPLYNHLH